MENMDKLTADRVKKLKEIRDLGVDPYPYSYAVKNYAKEVLDQFGGLKVEQKGNINISLAGRVMNLRGMGKASFGHIQDRTGKIQFYIKQDEVGEKDYSLFKKLDIGDVIGINGYVFKTKKGELTVGVKKIDLLVKSLRPLPEKWHGLKDSEIRYRQRYIDLLMNLDVKEVFEKRGKIISSIREFLDKKGFTEVETPTLQLVYGGANARPFKTHINAWDLDMFLSISPELYLKRLIIGGMEKVYTICKNFRNEGVDRTHNPEFTMLEFYQVYIDYEEIMKMTEELYQYVAKKVLGTIVLNYQGKKIDLKSPWKKLTMSKAIKQYLEIDADKMSDEELRNFLINYNIEYKEDFSRGLAIARIFEELVEDKLIGPVHIIDHPKETTPLCKAKRGNHHLIERIEPYIMGCELGNGYSELNDPIKQKELLVEQEKKGRGGDEEAHPMDEEFIKALEYGMPPTGGMGIGIDRMVMLMTNSKSIREVILFPTMKPVIDEKNK